VHTYYTEYFCLPSGSFIMPSQYHHVHHHFLVEIQIKRRIGRQIMESPRLVRPSDRTAFCTTTGTAACLHPHVWLPPFQLASAAVFPASVGCRSRSPRGVPIRRFPDPVCIVTAESLVEASCPRLRPPLVIVTPSHAAGFHFVWVPRVFMAAPSPRWLRTALVAELSR